LYVCHTHTLTLPTCPHADNNLLAYQSLICELSLWLHDLCLLFSDERVFYYNTNCRVKLSKWTTVSNEMHKKFITVCQIGRSEICLVLGSQNHFVQILQELFAVFYNLKKFVHIPINARIFVQEINSLQRKNFTVWSQGFMTCYWMGVLTLNSTGFNGHRPIYLISYHILLKVIYLISNVNKKTGNL
jgi:hypothetical protein